LIREAIRKRRQKMVEIKGTASEVRDAVAGLVPTWPVSIIDDLDPGELHFILNGVDTLVVIMEEPDE
jgi:hypothetical protein